MRKGIQLQTESLKQHACLITSTSIKIQCIIKYIKGWLHSVVLHKEMKHITNEKDTKQ